VRFCEKGLMGIMIESSIFVLHLHRFIMFINNMKIYLGCKLPIGFEGMTMANTMEESLPNHIEINVSP
jgi:hypothetical protein